MGMTIGFIGAGKMARALAAGLVRGGVVSPADLLCCSRSVVSGQPFLDLFPAGGPHWLEDPAQVAARSDVIVLAIKPQQFGDLLPHLRETVAGKLILSLAAGLTLERIGQWLGSSTRLVRAMPNMPMQIGLGASVYAGNDQVTADDYAWVDRALSAAGRAWRVEETQIDPITALSGSGPAYVFHFIDALIVAAQALNLPEPLARALALQTVLGSAHLAAESQLSPLELADQVKSPGGTTLAGCAVLEKDDALRHLMTECLAAARARAETLAKGST